MYDEVDYSIYYNKFHFLTPQHIAEQNTFYARILNFILEDLKPDARILDFGCGIGFCVNALHSLGFKNANGIDISGEQIQAGKNMGFNVEHYSNTLTYIQDNTDQFDLIIAFDVLEHIPVEQQLIHCVALKQALRQDAKLICMVPNANSSLAERWRYNDWTHQTSFTEHSIEFLLKNAGFSDVIVNEVEFVPRPKHLWALYRKHVRTWWLRQTFRSIRRLVYYSELGNEAWNVPLSLNILATAKK